MGDYCRGKKRRLVRNGGSLYLNTDLPYPNRLLARPAGSQSWRTPPSQSSPGQNRADLVQAACRRGPLWKTNTIWESCSLSRMIQVVVWLLVMRFPLHTFLAWWTWSVPPGFARLHCLNPGPRSQVQHKGRKLASPEPRVQTDRKL